MVKKIQTFSRFALGLIYLVFGGMGVAIAFGFMKMQPPPNMPEAAQAFMNGMMATGYFFPFLKITEALFGLCLVIGLMVPASLVFLGPVTVHIILYHGFLTPSPAEMALPVFMGITHVLAMSRHWSLYRPLFGSGRS